MTYVLDSKTGGDVVTLSEMKEFLKVTNALEDTLIQSLINAAIFRAEKKMNRDILTANWINFRDTFFSDLTLRRGAFQSLTTVEFLQSGSYVVLAATEFIVRIGGSFGVICEINAPDSGTECNLVKISFKTGFGDAAANVPEDIKTAIKFDVSNLYSNRGDCKGADFDLGAPAANVYRSYRLIDVSGEESDLNTNRRPGFLN